MTDDTTQAWRLQALEKRMDAIEARMQVAMYALIANLVGVIGLLAKAYIVR